MQIHHAIRGWRAILTRIFFSIVIVTGLGLNSARLFFTSADEHFDHIVITEFLAANHTGLVDEDGDYSDWIEIYNSGSQPINLAGWSLTDDPTQSEKWAFPNITLGSQTYLLIFASGKDRRPSQPGLELHTNFKLDQQGDFLGLYNVFAGRFIDVASVAGPPPAKASLAEKFPEQFPDISYGRYGDEPGILAHDLPFGYLDRPTPGQPNAETLLWIGLVGPVNFSSERGFYEEPFTLALTTDTPGATIHYTTDGSPPTETHGAVYTTPIAIDTTTLIRVTAFKPGFRPAPVETHTYIFPDDVLLQPKAPPHFPRSWGGYKGAPVTADYEMDPEVINDPRYKALVEDALKSIPTLSLVTDMRSFHDLYANPKRKGRAWERPASVEFIQPGKAGSGFQIDAGLRTQGELGRAEYMPKHAFRLFFRREYGAAKLEYPLFPTSPVKAFDTLVLRSGVNRSYAGYPEREDEIRLTTYTRDEWLRASQIEMSGLGSHGIFVHLYLNGLYWGLYNVVERPDEAFMSSYFGGAKDDWQVVSHAESAGELEGRFKTLHDMVAEGQLDDPARYARISSSLDIPRFIDYLILNWYVGNLDWAFNNWYAGVRNPAGPVNYFVWDGERTWFDGAEIFMDMDEYKGRPNLVRPLFEALLTNPDFRVEFADRMHRHLFEGGALADENSQARWLRLNNIIEQAIVAESARWGDTRFDVPLTQEDWFEARDDVLAQMKGNAAWLITLAREAGYYPDFDPPLFNQPGGSVPAGFNLSLIAPEGSVIYYTTDGSDPRLPLTGEIAPTAQVYYGPLLLATTTQIKARTLPEDSLPGSGQTLSPGVGQPWSALNEAIFTIDDAAEGRLQVTEIMYNPIGGQDYEFIELKNSGFAPLDLGNLSFEGITFTFPPIVNEPLAPGKMMVLVSNPEAFARRYPGIPIGGVYSGQLSNKGETLAVLDGGSQIIISLDYNDDQGWPVSPDGQGDSLVLVDLDGDPNDPHSWRASANPNGSPGLDESFSFGRD